MSELKSALPLRQVIPVLIVYVIVTILGLYYHELGLEEGQTFMFARDSRSLADLYQNMRYEGHPRLWCSLLYSINHNLTSSFTAIQIIHLLITSTTVFLFLRFAPFERWSKVGIVFGYYFLFEYNLQVRSYAPGILLLFITCMLLSKPEKKLALIGVLLFLLCNTDIFYAIAAGGIYLSLLVEYARLKQVLTPAFLGLTAFCIAGLACSLIQAQIPRQDYIVQGGFLPRNLRVAPLAVTAGWIPVPGDGGHFWNSFWVQHIGELGRGILCVPLLLFPLAVLKGRRRALVFYYSSLGCLLLLLVISTLGAARYYGMVFIYFLAACWMEDGGSFRPLVTRDGGGRFPAPGLLRVSFGVLVAVQLVAGVYALLQDIRRPFSQAKNAVAFIKAHRLADQQVVVNGYIAGPALCVYLMKKVWYLNTGGEGSFCLWKRAYFPLRPPTVPQEVAAVPALDRLDRFLLLSNRELDGQMVRDGVGDFRLDPLTSFTNGILPDEDCYIYQATKRVVSLK